MSLPIFNGPLTNAFQPSLPLLINDSVVVLDTTLVIAGGPVRVEWYPEFTDDNPFDVNTRWYRELAEEDVGNGDVRMALTIRRFSTYGADADLPPGTYQLDAQFRRVHDFCRIQIRGLGATARVIAPFGSAPSPA